MKKVIKELENGDLEFSISKISKEDKYDLTRIKNSSGMEQDTFSELFERELEGNYYFVPEHVYEELGVLTSSPLICDYDFWNEDEEDKKEFTVEMGGIKVWHYPNYMLYNGFEELIQNKKFVWKLAENN